jgi:SAM-dependent methyltransferase
MSHDLDLWNSSAEAWITSQGEKGDSSRQFLDPFVLDLLGDVTGKSIADIGCGEGRFARLLTTKAARVTGVEPAENLFNAAETNSTGETYLCEGATELSIADQSQDVVIFYLSMIDFDPFEPAISEANRILKPGGRCMVINTSSMDTASDSMWLRDENNKKIAWLVEKYAKPHHITAEWADIKIINYHRPLSHYFQAFLKANFTLLDFLEPVPTDEQIEAEPGLASYLIVPFFNIHYWQK